MPLELYKRRHSAKCLREMARRIAAKEIRPPDLEQYDCPYCAWWVRGRTDAGEKIRRHSLKVFTRPLALAALRKLNVPKKAARPVSAPAPADGERVLLTEAQKQWLNECENVGRCESTTLTAYTRTSQMLIDFMAKQSFHYVDEAGPLQLTQMRAEWKVKANTHRSYRTAISTFLNFCYRMGWIDDNPMKRTRGVTVWAEDDDRNATMPIDAEGDANYRKICESIVPFLRNEIDRPGRTRKRDRRGAFLSHPENFLGLAHLLYETGMRISDAAHFDPAKIEIDERGASYTFRPIKTRKRSNKKVTAFLDSWLADELRGLEKLDGVHPFLDGREDWRTFINNNIRPVLAELGKAIGIPGLRPHRFRDSFAVNRLNEGVDIYDLKELLGHASVAMTERYYAPWVKSRTISLQQRLQAAKEAAARNVISIRKAS